MRDERKTLEEKMTTEERKLFEKFKQQIGKEFLIEVDLDEHSYSI